MAVIGGELYVVDNTGDELWKIDHTDPDRTTGGFGLVGDSPDWSVIPIGSSSHWWRAIRCGQQR